MWQKTLELLDFIYLQSYISYIYRSHKNYLYIKLIYDLMINMIIGLFDVSSQLLFIKSDLIKI